MVDAAGSHQTDLEAHLDELVGLLAAFRDEVGQDDLRGRVQALVPVHDALAALDRSLIPVEIASSARERLLYYFLSYPYTVIPREELLIVGAIGEWARRIRELRVEYGWSIISGSTAQALQTEDDFPLPDVDVSAMRPDDYIMTSTEQDRDAAHRWHIAKTIRNRDISVRARILSYLRENVGRPIPGDELQYVAKDRTEWARRVRELRTEYGWSIVTHSSGRPDLAVGVYVLESLRQSPEHDRRIPDSVRGQVLRRDRYRCQRCGWTHDMWNRSDPRHLELHHMTHHEAGGENSAENLITLCTVCHDAWHALSNEDIGASFADWLRTG